MLGSTLFLLKSVSLDVVNGTFLPYLNILVITGTFSLLAFTKIRPPYIVLGCLILGWAL
jgi:chromate transporter